MIVYRSLLNSTRAGRGQASAPAIVLLAACLEIVLHRHLSASSMLGSCSASSPPAGNNRLPRGLSAPGLMSASAHPAEQAGTACSPRSYHAITPTQKPEGPFFGRSVRLANDLYSVTSGMIRIIARSRSASTFFRPMRLSYFHDCDLQDTWVRGKTCLPLGMEMAI